MAARAILGRIIIKGFGLLPPRAAIRLGRALGRRFSMKLLREKNFRRNFCTAFPELPLDRLIEEAAEHFGAVAALYPHLGNVLHGRRGASLALEGLENVPQGPAIFVGGHVKFWEVGPLALEHTGSPQLMIYSGLGEPWLSDLLLSFRKVGRVAFVEKGDALRASLEHLKAGGSLGLLMDQRTASGMDVPFFGKPARFTHLPARLALRFGLPIIPMEETGTQDAQFRVRFLPPIQPQGKTEQEITAEIAAVIEDIIGRSPGQWFCNKRRWPGRGKA